VKSLFIFGLVAVGGYMLLRKFDSFQQWRAFCAGLMKPDNRPAETAVVQ